MRKNETKIQKLNGDALAGDQRIRHVFVFADSLAGHKHTTSIYFIFHASVPTFCMRQLGARGSLSVVFSAVKLVLFVTNRCWKYIGRME
jgi:hypothetical protein